MDKTQTAIMDEFARRVKKSCSICSRKSECPYQGNWEKIIDCSLDNYNKIKS